MFERTKNFLHKLPLIGSGKDPMAEATTAAPIDTKALGEAIAASLTTSLTAALGPAMATAIGEANKPLVEQLGKMQPQQQPASAANAGQDKGGKDKPLTLDDVGRVVADQLKTFTQQSNQSAQRDAYITGKLKDLPAAYRNQLGTDPAKWAEEEQRIRGEFKTDLEAAGLKPKDVGGAAPAGGSPPSSSVDLSKLNPTQLAELSFKQAAAGKSDASNGAAAAATAK